MKTPSRMTLGLILTLAASHAAFAHAKLVSANPPVDGAAATPPQTLDLLFSEEISGKLSGATVKGADGKAIPVTTITEKAGKGLMVMMRAPLKPGAYTVDWHAVASDDGHKTTGAYRFRVN